MVRADGLSLLRELITNHLHNCVPEFMMPIVGLHHVEDCSVWSVQPRIRIDRETDCLVRDDKPVRVVRFAERILCWPSVFSVFQQRYLLEEMLPGSGTIARRVVESAQAPPRECSSDLKL